MSPGVASVGSATPNQSGRTQPARTRHGASFSRSGVPWAFVPCKPKQCSGSGNGGGGGLWRRWNGGGAALE